MIEATAKKDNNEKYNYGYKNRRQDQRIKGTRLKAVLTFVITLLLIGGIFVTYIGQSLEITHLNYQLAELKQELEQLEENNHLHRLELASKSSLARVERIARNQLKMVDPEDVQIVVLNRPGEQNIPLKNESEPIFLVKAFNSLLERLGTVKAGGFLQGE